MQKTFGEKLKKGIDNYFDTRPVGGHIPVDRFCEWEEYTERCRSHGISVSYEGFFDMLKTSNRINRTLFPLAEKYGYDPMDFKNEVIDIMITALAVVEKTDLFEKTALLHEEILAEVDKRFKSKIDDTIRHNETKNFKNNF